jgi:hypothetical protein
MVTILSGLFLKENGLGNLFFNPAERGEEKTFTPKEVSFIKTFVKHTEERKFDVDTEIRNNYE